MRSVLRLLHCAKYSLIRRRSRVATLFCSFLIIATFSYWFIVTGIKPHDLAVNQPDFHPPIVSFRCQEKAEATIRSDQGQKYFNLLDSKPKHLQRTSLNVDLHVLVFVESDYSNLGREIVHILQSLKLSFRRVITSNRGLPPLTHHNASGRYAVIVFENLYRYINMDKWNRQILDKYCQDYEAGLVLFMRSKSGTRYRRAKVKGFPLLVSDNVSVRDLQVPNIESPFFHITKTGGFIPGRQESDDWVAFFPSHDSYESLLVGSVVGADDGMGNDDVVHRHEEQGSIVLRDRGGIDGVHRIFLGRDFSLWLIRPLFVDALAFFVNQEDAIPLERYLQIDIDDIFVGETGYRMTEGDVKALINAQSRIREAVPGFLFNLGYSAKFFHRGNDYESRGEDFLLAAHEHFRWFPHSFSHRQAHFYAGKHSDALLNLRVDMTHNKEFGEKYGLNLSSGYAVAPHHSGVYPVYQPMYDAWRDVFNIQATSTEEYPHLKPSGLRRGFIHNGVMVMPRLTCGIFTHTTDFRKYPRGVEFLHKRIFGGDIFESFLYNPFMVFMTHSTNYARDRLALYLFESVIPFVQCWTNLQLRHLPPLDMAKAYFARYPSEVEPIWGNPCTDKRHMDIWPYKPLCPLFPGAVILGPQKTGTTALFTFLNLHPSVRSSLPSEANFEEIQFFSGKYYHEGILWYLKHFLPEGGVDIATYCNLTGNADSQNATSPPRTNVLRFEKSATYFDSEVAPARLAGLLPTAKLIAIISSPITRAYSWYQHMRAHADETALQYSFEEVLRAPELDPDNYKLMAIRNKCLKPGLYAKHIERWLNQFMNDQLLLIDGDLLKKNPIQVMNQVQIFLQLEPRIDYSTLISFDIRKGFYCPLVLPGNKTKCLGRSKGRHYEPISDWSRDYLLNFYKTPNVQLQRLLKNLNHNIPRWLELELKETGIGEPLETRREK